MATFNPFRGLRPTPSLAAQVAAPPYDVLSSEEAKSLARGNPYTYLHVTKSEIDLPDHIGHYDPLVYETARNNLQKMVDDHVLNKDENPRYYLYRQIMNGRTQTGIVGVASVDEYITGTIKIHEQTREDKELDRINHVKTTGAQTGPVFLTYHDDMQINSLVENWVKEHNPTYDFVADDGITHTLWVVDDSKTIDQLQKQFYSIQAFYVADGHHRSAAAVKVAKELRETQKIDRNHPANFFLAVSFPESQLKILDYNRLVKDLGGHKTDQFLKIIRENFDCEKCQTSEPFKPQKTHEFGMFLAGNWYRLCAKKHILNDNDPIQTLDVYILQNYLLSPVLSIKNPRTDKRIDFIGGIRGLLELEKRSSELPGSVAFSMYPTTLQELMHVADANLLMPPKSTWFEPKLRCGMVTHQINN